MKRLFYFMALIMLFALDSCKKDDGITYGFDYGRSNLAWQNFKSASGDTYRYQVVTSSWVGYGTETIITVRNGKVAERSYVEKVFPGTGGPATITKEWKEDETQLGMHEEGAALLTMDEVYAKAKDDWLLKRDNAKTYFETKNDGMISLCGYVPNGCEDDCFNGITIGYVRGV